MKPILITLLTLICCCCITPQAAIAQTSEANQEQLNKLKQDYKEGKITLEEYQKKSNELLNSSTPVLMTTTPGDHFQKGGRCLIAGGVFTILGAGALASGWFIPYNNTEANITQISAGGGILFIGLILDIAGGAQLIKGGKKLNALKIGQTALLEITPAANGAALAFKF